MAAYSLVNMLQNADASLGFWTFLVTMDPRYCSLVSYVTAELDQDTAADADIGLAIDDISVRTPPQFLQGPVSSVSALLGDPSVAVTWSPVPTILGGGSLRPQLTVRGANVDGDVYRISMLVYLFDIDVRTKTPMGPLLWARGAT